MCLQKSRIILLPSFLVSQCGLDCDAHCDASSTRGRPQELGGKPHQRWLPGVRRINTRRSKIKRLLVIVKMPACENRSRRSLSRSFKRWYLCLFDSKCALLQYVTSPPNLIHHTYRCSGSLGGMRPKKSAECKAARATRLRCEPNEVKLLGDPS